MSQKSVPGVEPSRREAIAAVLYPSERSAVVVGLDIYIKSLRRRASDASAPFEVRKWYADEVAKLVTLKDILGD